MKLTNWFKWFAFFNFPVSMLGFFFGLYMNDLFLLSLNAWANGFSFLVMAYEYKKSKDANVSDEVTE